MDNHKAKTLLEKYKAGTLNDDEKHLLDQWYAKLAGTNKLNLKDTELEQNLDDIWSVINLQTAPQHQLKPVANPVLNLWRKVAAVAAVLVIVGTGAYFYTNRDNKERSDIEQLSRNVKPGGNKATLTLANGKVITLDSAVNGKLAEQSGIVITKTKDGQLVYTVADQRGRAASGPIGMHTISTPKGGQYQVNLPDGSRVWLNASSSLRYPAQFTGLERKVILTGEAYFEVAKVLARNEQVKRIPFVVITDQQRVEVLGTHFNINAYADEPDLKTTLLEGAVKVSTVNEGNQSFVLKPGMQSSYNGTSLNVNIVNVEDAVAWKNGMFKFKDADLKTVMRSVARWYDVEIAYEGGTLPKKEFSGEIYRNLNLDQVLDLLSFYNVHFRVEGKRIVVTP